MGQAEPGLGCERGVCVGGGEARGAQERRPLSGSQRPPELGVCAAFFPAERSSLPPLALQVCCLKAT